VVRDGAEVVADTVKVADLHRSPSDLVAWLFRAMEFPVGVVLLTGTAIVPPVLRGGNFPEWTQIRMLLDPARQ
jgi:2-dehydro-3-deoxy-D-arabinonate dehydratase